MFYLNIKICLYFLNLVMYECEMNLIFLYRIICSFSLYGYTKSILLITVIDKLVIYIVFYFNFNYFWNYSLKFIEFIGLLWNEIK